MSSCTERLKNGIITENPTFVMMLGMCPTLAVTSSAINGLGKDPYHRSGFFSAHYKFSQKFSSFFVLVAVNL